MNGKAKIGKWRAFCGAEVVVDEANGEREGLESGGAGRLYRTQEIWGQKNGGHVGCGEEGINGDAIGNTLRRRACD